MSKCCFTEEQISRLQKNPYVYQISSSRIFLTKEFKELFMIASNEGRNPRRIFESYGFDLADLGDRRIRSLAGHIHEEYKRYGDFFSGPRPAGTRKDTVPSTSKDAQPISEKEEIRLLKHEVEYLKQEMEFLKKISSIKHTQK